MAGEQGSPEKGNPTISLAKLYTNFEKKYGKGNVAVADVMVQAAEMSRQLNIPISTALPDEGWEGWQTSSPSDFQPILSAYGDWKSGIFRSKVRPVIDSSTGQPFRKSADERNPQARYADQTIPDHHGDEKPIDSPERMAAGRGVWIDMAGKMHPLTENTHKDIDLVTDYNTDSDGNMLPGYYLRERNPYETTFGKSLVSKFGYQDEDGGFFSGAGSGALKGVIGTPAMVTSLFQFDDPEADRMKKLITLQELYGIPRRAATVQNFLDNGELSTGLDGVDHPIINREIKLEEADKLYKELKANEEEIRKLAGQGDKKALQDLRVIEAGDSRESSTYWSRYFEKINRIDQLYTPKLSAHAGEGGFWDAEALGSGLGYSASAMLYGMFGAGLTAGALRTLGTKAMLTKFRGEMVKKAAKEAIEAEAKSLGAEAGKDIAIGAGRTMLAGAAQDAPGFVASGIEGLQMAGELMKEHLNTYGNTPETREEALMMGAAMVVGNYGVRSLIGAPWYTNAYRNAMGIEKYSDVIKRELSISSKAGLDKQGRLARVFKGTLDWLDKGSKVTKAVKGTAYATYHESFEEASQEELQILVEDLSDYFTGKNGYEQKYGPSNTRIDRILHAAGMGALVGGPMHVMHGAITGSWDKPEPFDSTIYGAVLDGNATQVRKTADNMLAGGMIDKDQRDIIEADVRRAETAFSELDFRYGEEYAKTLSKSRTFMRAYSNAVVARDKARLGLSSLGESATSEQKSAAESTLKATEEHLEFIKQGRLAVQTAKDDELVKRAFRDAGSDGKLKALNAMQLDGMVSEYKDFKEGNKAESEAFTKNRNEALPEFDKAIADLRNADSSNIDQALSAYAQIAKRMRDGRFFSSEDARAAHQAILEARARIKAEIAASIIQEASPASDGKEAKEQVLFGDVMDDELDNVFNEKRTNGYTDDQNLAIWSSPEYEKNRGFKVNAELQGKLNSFVRLQREVDGGGLKELTADEKAAMFPSKSRTIDHGSDFLFHLPMQERTRPGSSGGGGSEGGSVGEGSSSGPDASTTTFIVDVRNHLASLKLKEDISIDELNDINAIISELEKRIKLVEALPILSDKESQYRQYKGESPKAFREWRNEVDVEYKELLAGLRSGKEQVMEIQAELKREHDRLANQLDIRNRSIATRVEASNRIAAHIFQVAVGHIGKKMDAPLKEYLQALAKNPSSVDTEAKRALVERVLHEELANNPAKALEIHKHVVELAGLMDTEGLRINSSYSKIAWQALVPTVDFHTADLFDKKKREEISSLIRKSVSKEFVLAPVVTMFSANLLLRASRVDPASLYRAMDLVMDVQKKRHEQEAKNGKKGPYKGLSPEQRDAALSLAAFLVNPRHPAASQVLDDTQVFGAKQGSTVKVNSGSFFVPGSPGAGKTEMVSYAVAMYSKVTGKTKPEIVIITAGNEENKSRLRNDILAKIPGAQVSEMNMTDIGKSDLKDGSLIIVDEAHHLEFNQHKKLVEAADTDKGPTLVMLGDINQSQSIDSSSFNLPYCSSQVERSVPLDTSFRSGNTEVLNTTSLLRKKIYDARNGGNKIPEMPGSKYTENSDSGVRWITTSVDDVYSAFANNLMRDPADSGPDSILIVLNNSQRNDAISFLRKALKDAGRLDLQGAMEERVKTMASGKESAMGSNTGKAYVAILPSALGNEFARVLYTAVTRASDAFVAFLPSSNPKQSEEVSSIAKSNEAGMSSYGEIQNKSIKTVVAAFGNTRLDIAPTDEGDQSGTGTEPPFSEGDLSDGTHPSVVDAVKAANDIGRAFASIIEQGYSLLKKRKDMASKLRGPISDLRVRSESVVNLANSLVIEESDSDSVKNEKRKGLWSIHTSLVDLLEELGEINSKALALYRNREDIDRILESARQAISIIYKDGDPANGLLSEQEITIALGVDPGLVDDLVVKGIVASLLAKNDSIKNLELRFLDNDDSNHDLLNEVSGTLSFVGDAHGQMRRRAVLDGIDYDSENPPSFGEDTDDTSAQIPPGPPPSGGGQGSSNDVSDEDGDDGSDEGRPGKDYTTSKQRMVSVFNRNPRKRRFGIFTSRMRSVHAGKGTDEDSPYYKARLILLSLIADNPNAVNVKLVAIEDNFRGTSRMEGDTVLDDAIEAYVEFTDPIFQESYRQSLEDAGIDLDASSHDARIIGYLPKDIPLNDLEKRPSDEFSEAIEGIRNAVLNGIDIPGVRIAGIEPGQADSMGPNGEKTTLDELIALNRSRGYRFIGVAANPSKKTGSLWVDGHGPSVEEEIIGSTGGVMAIFRGIGGSYSFVTVGGNSISDGRARDLISFLKKNKGTDIGKKVALDILKFSSNMGIAEAVYKAGGDLAGGGVLKYDRALSMMVPIMKMVNGKPVYKLGGIPSSPDHAVAAAIRLLQAKIGDPSVDERIRNAMASAAINDSLPLVARNQIGGDPSIVSAFDAILSLDEASLSRYLKRLGYSKSEDGEAFGSHPLGSARVYAFSELNPHILYLSIPEASSQAGGGTQQEQVRKRVIVTPPPGGAGGQTNPPGPDGTNGTGGGKTPEELAKEAELAAEAARQEEARRKQAEEEEAQRLAAEAKAREEARKEAIRKQQEKIRLREIFGKVFGDRFLSGKLPFKTRLDRQDPILLDEVMNDVWARLDMLLKGHYDNASAAELAGQIAKALLTKESYNELINELRIDVAGGDFSQTPLIGELEALDLFAKLLSAYTYKNRGGAKDGFTKQFTSFVRSSASRWERHKGLSSKLVSKIETGSFRSTESVPPSKDVDTGDPTDDFVPAGATDVIMLSRMFGSRGVREVSNSLRNEVLARSSFAPPSDTNISSPSLSLEDAARSLHEEYMARFSTLGSEDRMINVVRDGKPLRVDVSDVLSTDVRSMTDAEKELYFAWHLTNGEVFAAVLNQAVEGVEFKSRTVARVVDVDGAGTDNGDGYAKSERVYSNEIYLDNERRNPSRYSRQSKMLALHGVHLMEDLGLPGGGGIRETNEIADWTILENVMLQAAAFASVNPSVSANEAIAKKLISIYRGDPTGKFGRHAQALYHRFYAGLAGVGSNEAIPYLSIADALSGNGPSTYSYRQASETPELFYQDLTNDRERANVSTRIRGVSDLLNSITSHYMSLVTSGYIKYEETLGDNSEGPGRLPQSRIIRLRFDWGTSEMENLRKHLGNLFLATPEGVTVSSDIRRNFVFEGMDHSPLDSPTTNKKIKVSKDGVSLLYRDKNGGFTDEVKLVFFKNSIPHLVHPDMAKVGPEVYADFFSAFGYPVDSSVIERMYEENVQGNEHYGLFGPEDGAGSINTGIGMLAGTIGVWAYSVYEGTQQIMGLKGDPAISTTVDHLKKTLGFSPDFISVRVQGDEKDTDPIATPGSFFRLNSQLAVIQTSAKGSEYARRLINEDQEAEFVNNASSQFQRLIPPGWLPFLRSPLFANLGLLSRSDPALVTNGKPTLSLMSQDNWLKLVSTARVMGVQVTDYEGKGAAANSQPIQDQVAAEMDTFMKTLLESNEYQQELVVRLAPFANRKPEAVSLMTLLPQDKIFNLAVSDDGIRSVTLNRGKLDSLFLDMYAYVQATEKASLERISALISSASGTEVSFRDHAEASAALDALYKLNPGIIGRSNLIANLDYSVSGDSIVPGGAGKRDGVWGLDAASSVMSSDSVSEAIDAIIEPEITGFRMWMAQNGKMDDKGNISAMDLRKILSSWKISDVAKEGSDAVYNELIKGYFLLSTVVNQTVAVMSMGPLGSFKGASDIVKRGASVTSGNWVANLKEADIIGTFVVVSDPPAELHPESGLEVAPVDGQSFFTPWGYTVMRDLYGNDLGVMNRGVVKMLYSARGVINKAAWGEPTAEYYLMNPLYRSWIQRYLSDKRSPGGRNLLEIWNEIIGDLPDKFAPGSSEAVREFTERYNEAVQVFSSRDITGRLTTFFTTPSSIKQGLKNVNPIVPADGGSSGMIEQEMDNRFFGFQVDLSRDAREYSAAQLNQIFAMVSSVPGNEDLIDQLSSLSEASTESFLRQLDSIMGDGEEADRKRRLIEWMRKMTLRSVEKQGDAVQLHEALFDPDMDVNNPVVMGKVVPFILSKLKNEGFNPRLYGQQYSQHSSYGIEIPDVGVDAEGKQVMVRRSLRAPGIREVNGRKGYVPGEVILRLPQEYIDLFGITDVNMTPEEMKEDIRIRMGDEAADLFDDSLNVYVSRTPASGVASGQWMRIVGFVNDASNTIYTPTGLNALTGGDFDGDQLTVLFGKLHRKGESGVGRDARGSNLYLDILREFYMGEGREDNLPYIFSSIGTRRIKEAVDKLNVERPSIEYGTPMGNILLRQEVQTGDELIDIFAAQNKAFGYILGAWFSMNKKVDDGLLPKDSIGKAFGKWSPDVLEEGGEHYRLENFSEFLNAALDNIKLAVLGGAKINRHNVPIVVGMLASGKTVDDIVKAMSSPGIEKATALVNDSRRYIVAGPRSASIDIITAIRKAGLPTEEARVLSSYVAISEQLRRYSQIIGLKKNGIGSSPREFMGVIDSIEFNVGANLSDILAGTVTPESRRKYMAGRKLGKDDRAFEDMVRKQFDILELIKNDPGVMSHLRAAARMKELFGGVFTVLSPEMAAFELSVSGAVGEGKLFDKSVGISYDRAVSAWFVSDWLTKKGDKDVLLADNTGGGPIDLSTHEGRNWFLARFPQHWSNIMEAMRRDPAVRKSMGANRVIQELRVVRNEYGFRSLEMEDSRRLHGNVNKNIATEDIIAISDAYAEMIESGKLPEMEGLWDMPLVDQLAIYSMLKDKFSMSKSSLAIIMPASTQKDFAAYLGSMAGRTPDAGFIEDFVVSHHRLVPHEKNEAAANATYYRSGQDLFRKKGKAPLHPINNGWMMNYAPDGPVNSSGEWTLPNSSIDVMDAIMKGSKEVVLSGWLPEDTKTVVLPTGDKVNVIRIDNESRLVTVDMGTVSNQNPDSITHPGGTLYSLRREGHDEFTASRVSDDVKERLMKDTSSVGILSTLYDSVSDPLLKRLIGLMRSNGERSVRSGSLSFVPIEQDNTGWHRDAYVEGGNIFVNDGITGDSLVRVVLHEMTHRFTAQPFLLQERDLSPEELAFKRGITGLMNRSRGLFPENKWDHAFSSPEEFIAAAFSDMEFQMRLQVNNDGKAKVSFFQRLVDWIMSLLGIDRLKDMNSRTMMEQVIDVTSNYLEFDTRRGQREGFLASVSQLPGRLRSAYTRRLWSRTKLVDPPAGKKIEIKDIKDISSLLQVNPLVAISPDEKSNASIADKQRKRFRKLQRLGIDEMEVRGHTYNIGSMDEAAFESILQSEIIPLIKSADGQRSFEIVEHLNANASELLDDSVQAWETRFSLNGLPMHKKSEIYRFLRSARNTGGTVHYALLSSLQDGKKDIEMSNGKTVKLSEIGNFNLDGFEGYDPIVRIVEMNGTYTADFLQFTSSPVGLKENEGSYEKLLDRYLKGAVNSNMFQSVGTAYSVGGLRKFTLAMTMLAAKKANPKMSIGKGQVLSLGSNGFDSDTVQLQDLFKELKAIRNIPEIWDNLPGKIKDVLADDTLYEIEKYRVPVLQSVLDFYNDSGRNLEDTQLSVSSALARYDESDEPSRDLLKRAVRLRMAAIEQMQETPGIPSGDVEYDTLASLFVHLSSGDIVRKGSNKDKGYAGLLMTSTYNMAHEGFQALRTETLNAANKIGLKMRDLYQESGPLIEKMYERRGMMKGRFVDRGYNLFEPLFIMSPTVEGVAKHLEVRDSDGNLISVSTGMIHWDRNAPETIAALAEEKIFDEDLDYANYFLDKVHEYLVNMVEQEIYSDSRKVQYILDRSGTSLTKEMYIRRWAEKHVKANYTRGFVPVEMARAGELLSRSVGLRAKTGTYFKSLGHEMENMDATFSNEYVDRRDDNGYVANGFLQELGESAGSSALGSTIRLGRMGMAVMADGSVVMNDPSKNSRLTMNLEQTLRHFVMSSERKLVMDRDVVPLYHSVKSLMRSQEILDGVAQKNNILALDDWARKQIFGDGAVMPEDPIARMGLAKVANMATAAVSYVSMSFNWKVGLLSGVVNSMSTVGLAVSSAIAGDGDFTPPSVMKALQFYYNPENRHLIRALTEKFFIHEGTLNELANPNIYSKTQSLWTSSRAGNIMNLETDRFARQIAMFAQMVEDGSLGAFSIKESETEEDILHELVYDVKKDGRFYNENGELKENAELLMGNIRKRLIKDGIFGQKEGEPLVFGYDLMYGRKFKTLADKYIIGAMDTTTQGMFSSYVLGRMVGLFRRYLNDKIYNYVGGRTSIDELGKDVIKTDAEGNKYAVWEAREVTSVLNSLHSAFTLIKHGRLASISDFRNNLGEAEKKALGRMIADIGWLGIMWGLITLIGSLGDDDDDRSTLARFLSATQVGRVFDNAMQDAFFPVAAADVVFGDQRSIAASASFAHRLLSTITDPEKLTNPEKLLPFTPLYSWSGTVMRFNKED